MSDSELDLYSHTTGHDHFEAIGTPVENTPLLGLRRKSFVFKIFALLVVFVGLVSVVYICTVNLAAQNENYVVIRKAKIKAHLATRAPTAPPTPSPTPLPSVKVKSKTSKMSFMKRLEAEQEAMRKGLSKEAKILIKKQKEKEAREAAKKKAIEDRYLREAKEPKDSVMGEVGRLLRESEKTGKPLSAAEIKKIAPNLGKVLSGDNSAHDLVRDFMSSTDKVLKARAAKKAKSTKFAGK